MIINSISPCMFTGLGSLTIYAKNNPKRTYLYNEVVDIIKPHNVPAVFHSQKIEISSPTKEVIEKLNKLGIYYEQLNKK